MNLKSNAVAENDKNLYKLMACPLRQKAQHYLDKEGASTMELGSQCKQPHGAACHTSDCQRLA
jgi:hypothetical protein